jgi:hypothetical protein
MQSIDSLGAFWLPDRDGDQLSGRLRFDPAGGGINLSLVGAFDNAVADGGEPAVRIFGWLGNNRVTLRSEWLSNHSLAKRIGGETKIN